MNMSMTLGSPITVPALLQQESMNLVSVALGIGVIGMVFGRLKKKSVDCEEASADSQLF